MVIHSLTLLQTHAQTLRHTHLHIHTLDPPMAAQTQPQCGTATSPLAVGALR